MKTLVVFLCCVLFISIPASGHQFCTDVNECPDCLEGQTKECHDSYCYCESPTHCDTDADCGFCPNGEPETCELFNNHLHCSCH